MSCLNKYQVPLPPPSNITGIETLCTSGSFTGLYEVWKNTDCISIFEPLPFESGQVWLDDWQRKRGLASYLLSRFLGGESILNPNDTAYNSFQENLETLCSSDRTVGVCDDSLQSLCSSCQRSDVSSSLDLSNFCGCYIPTEYPSIPTQGEGEGIVKECDTLCNQVKTAKKRSVSNGNVLRCQPGTVCVIDNTSLNISRSQGIKTTLSQTCTGCTASRPCYCVLDVDVTVDGLKTYDDFKQYCGSDSYCFKGGVSVLCSSTDEVKVNPQLEISWSVILIASVTLIILLLCVVLSQSHTVRVRSEL
jgi:hypothetical protein